MFLSNEEMNKFELNQLIWKHYIQKQLTEYSIQKVALKSSADYIGKHLYQSVFFNI